ncbi:hypothetical protein KR059_011067 [Drosophila kikkawai]|nr:hypothetical protein KR059_011067 [Drosophila kikkawai]
MSYNKKPDMLSLEPRESLDFEGPFNRSVCKSLIIENPNNKCVAFKLKTTSPRSFSVRPNLGTVGPNAKITVDVFMHPMIPDVGQKQDKFLVQAAFASGCDIDMQEFWKEQKPEDIWEAKIKCVLVQDKSSDLQLRQAGGASATPEPKPEDEIDFDVEEITQQEAQLLKQVSMLEDERLTLKEELAMMHDQAAMRQSKPTGKDYFKFASCVLTILAAILGAYYGKHYL